MALSKNAIYRLLLLAIVVAGFALRVYHLGDHGFFVDEIYSVMVADGTADSELAQFDAARPFYFCLLKLWLTISSDEAWLRFLSTIFGLGNIVLIAYLGKLCAGKKVGLVAALLMALSPMDVHYSQQARMYTLGSFMCISGSILLLQTFESKKKIYLFSWALTRLLMALTLPLTALLLLIDGIFAFSHRGKTNLLPLWTVCTAFMLLVWSPFLLIILKAQTSPYDSWRSSLDIPSLFDFLTLLISFTASAVPLKELGGMPVYDTFTAIYCGLLPFILLLAVALGPKQPKILWCSAWGLLPLSILFVWSQFRPPLFITRYTLFAAPFIFILFASSFVRLLQRSRLAAIITTIVYGLGIASYLQYFYNHPVHEDWRAVCQYVAAYEKKGDEIVVWNYHSHYFIAYYYEGQNHVSDMVLAMNKAKADANKAPAKNSEVTLDFDPKPGQRLWIISRQTAPGWQRMYHIYQNYLETINKQFKIISHSQIAKCDIFEAIVP